jgi:hypothetical protein
MNKPMSAARTLILIAAIGSVAAGCKKAEAPMPADTTATTTATVPTTSGTSATGGTSEAGMAGTAATSATGTTGATGATGSTESTTTSTAAGTNSGAIPGPNDGARPAVRNNSGETQGTTPNSSLPVSDGSR